MNLRIPSVGIFFPVKGRKDVIIVHRATLVSTRNTDIAATAWGKLEVLSLDAFEQEGLQIITDSFKGFKDREVREYTADVDQPEFASLSKSDKQRIKRGRLEVSASLRHNGDIWLTVPNTDYRVDINSATTNADFINGVKKLISIAKPVL